MPTPIATPFPPPELTPKLKDELVDIKDVLACETIVVVVGGGVFVVTVDEACEAVEGCKVVETCEVDETCEVIDPGIG